MHFSDDDMSANSSLSKRYVWGRIRQVQSDSDTRRNPRIEESNLLPKRQRQQVRHRIEKNISLIFFIQLKFIIKVFAFNLSISAKTITWGQQTTSKWKHFR